MADPKYRVFNISAYFSLRIMILVSTYTFSETRLPLKLISNHRQPQLASVAAIFQNDLKRSHFEKWLPLRPTEAGNRYILVLMEVLSLKMYNRHQDHDSK